MPLFARPPAEPRLSAADLSELHASVEAVRADLAAHRAITEAQGKVLATLPADTLRHFEDEVGAIANKLALAALKKAREEVFGGAVKWGTRAVLGLLGTWLVTQWGHLLGGLK